MLHGNIRLRLDSQESTIARFVNEDLHGLSTKCGLPFKPFTITAVGFLGHSQQYRLANPPRMSLLLMNGGFSKASREQHAAAVASLSERVDTCAEAQCDKPQAGNKKQPACFADLVRPRTSKGSPYRYPRQGATSCEHNGNCQSRMLFQTKCLVIQQRRPIAPLSGGNT